MTGQNTLVPCAFTDEISPDFEEAVRICAEEDVHEVEIRGIWGQNVGKISDDDVERMVAILGRYGVRVGCIGSPFGKCELHGDEYTEHLLMFERLVHLAEVFDTRLIRVFAFWLPGHRRLPDQPVSIEPMLAEIAERLRGPSERAHREGLVLALETEDATHVGTGHEARLVVDALANPAFRVCWDVVNGWHSGEPIFPDGYEQVHGLISHVHVKDAVPPDPTTPSRGGKTCRLGDGVVDWPKIVRTLRADGYVGALSLETHVAYEEPDRWSKRKAATVRGMRHLRRILAGS